MNRRRAARRAARRERRRELARLLQVNRMHVFVPAVMSIGLVFWLVSEMRELVRDSRDDARDKRAILGAAAVADSVLGEPKARSREAEGLRPRLLYLVVAAVLAGVAAYLSIGLYARQRSDLRDATPEVSGEAWLLSLAVVVAGVFFLYAAAALAVALRWQRAPAWAKGLVARSMLSVRPVDEVDYPGEGSRAVRLGVSIATAAAVVLAVVVAWVPDLVEFVDESIANWLYEHDSVDVFAFLDPLGSTELMLAFALLAGLAALRCRVLGAAYAAAMVAGLLVSVLVRPVVARARPPSGPHAGQFDSFPSGHILLAVLFAGAMPLALAVLFDRRWLVRPLRVVMGVGVAASAIHRVSGGTHWPTDVLGGALAGIALVLAVQWSVETERSHRLCRGCPWSHADDRRHERGLIGLRPAGARGIRLVAHVAAALAALGLAVLGVTRGLPTSSDGYVFPAEVVGPAQLGAAGLVSLAALVAWKWDAVGAALLALAATALGLFASVQYPPVVAVGMTVAILVPAVLLWLGWQHRRRPFEIVALAVVTALLVAGTWVGAAVVYDRYFGPTHPDSTAAEVPVDRVRWMWAGGLSATGATVVAELVDDARAAGVVFRAPSGDTVSSAEAAVDDDGLVRLTVDGLAPSTAYEYQLVVDGVGDEGRGVGRLRTPPLGASSFTIAAASCARVGSNGAVFDAIREQEPLLYLIMGDAHYSNLDATEPGPFLDAYERMLTEPGQAALYREVPIAYVWDDHDYGPNDADASSPSRTAARSAYRSAVPHYPVLPGDAPIYQAFTIGRVRVVMTDTRSERTSTTMLGEEQLEWLIDELVTGSRTHAAVIWVNAVPWIDAAAVGADTWGGYPQERQRIADAIAAAGVDNLVMLSGDAHMVAIDDGTNSGYAADGSPGFPVLHAAALDRPGRVKGGPYSEGTFPGGGQYGLVEITDDGGDTVTVRLSGHTWDGVELVSLTVRLDAGADAVTTS